MTFFVIHQKANSALENFTYDAGKYQAAEAIDIAHNKFGLENTTLYFPVDFDAYEYEVKAEISDFFKGVSEVFESSGGAYGLTAGIYSARNTCNIIANQGYVNSCFISGMSTAYSGNMAQQLPKSWVYNQIAEDSILEIDHDVMRYDIYDENENSVRKIELTNLKYKWALTGQLYTVDGQDHHNFLDPSYLGYDCPGGMQTIPFSDSLEVYSLSSVAYRYVNEAEELEVETWYIVDANNAMFFIPQTDVDANLLSFIREYKYKDIEIDTMGGIGRFDTTIKSVTVKGDTFNGLNGSTCPMSTGNNAVLSWGTDDNLNYVLVPFKPTAYTNGNTYYAMFDDWNAITIHEFPLT